MGPNVSTGGLFVCVSIAFVFCAPSKPTEKRNEEQKHITKNVVNFTTSLVLSTIAMGKISFLYKRNFPNNSCFMLGFYIKLAFIVSLFTFIFYS